MEDDDEEEVEPVKEELPQVTSDDGIFKVTVGPSIAVQNTGNTLDATALSVKAFTPAPRMSAGLAYKQGKLYLYGGQYEEGDKQLTFSDLYSLGKSAKFDSHEISK
jgi:hypothetical protein